MSHIPAGKSFRSSGIVLGQVQDAAGHVEVLVAEIVVLTVTSQDDPKVVADMAKGVLEDYTRTMDKAEIVEDLRYLADQLESMP